MKTIEMIAHAGLVIPRRALREGDTVLGNLVDFNENFWGQTGELLFPPGTAQFTRRLKMYSPLREADIGFDAIRHGEKKNDQELIYVGGAMAVRAVVSAFESREVPKTITATIVDGILENEIIPEEQPLLSDEIVERSHTPIDLYGHTVIHLFPSR